MATKGAFKLEKETDFPDNRVCGFPVESTVLLCSSGSKALDYSNGVFDCQSPTSPFMGSLRALHLLEDLRGVLEMMDTEERESLRCQIPDSTADGLVEWLHGSLVGPRRAQIAHVVNC